MIDRKRLTERVSAATLRLELRRALNPLVVVIIGLAVAAVAGGFIIKNINGGVGSTRTMRFAVADANGVVPGRAEVRFYGIEAGIVRDVKLVGGHPVLTVKVAKKYGPVYRNARAEIRPNTALQDLYLDIVDRGTPDAGVAASGDAIPLSQTRTPVNLSDVLNTFQPGVRTRLRALLDEFGNGLADRGEALRRTFAELTPLLGIAGNVSRQLAVRADLTKRAVRRASRLTSILASRSTQLRELVRSGTSSLEALSTGGGRPLTAAIHNLPYAMSTANGTLTAAMALKPNLDRALVRLQPVADELPSGLDNLETLARSMDPAVRKLRAPVKSLVPLTNQLQPLAHDLDQALQDIDPQVSAVDRLTRDASSCRDRINEFVNWDASAVGKLYDRRSLMTRGNFHFGFYTAPTVKQSNYTYGYQCAGGKPLGQEPTPKLPGPPPTP